MMLSLDDIRAADQLRIETVDVPDWGGSVCVREMSALEHIAMASAAEAGGMEQVIVLLALTMCDDQGNLIFADVESARDVLGKKKAATLFQIAGHAMKINGMERGAGDVEGN